MSAISFRVSPADSLLIERIVDRGRETDRHHKQDYCRTDALMDVIATHTNGNPLRLQDWLNADNAAFAHDWFGIRRYLDRETAQLTNHFLPRFSAPSMAEAA